MSERVKGVQGCKNREHGIENWLISQGSQPINTNIYKDFSDPDRIFYVVDGEVCQTFKNCTTAKLLDIVELPRWRAILSKEYYYIDDHMNVSTTSDMRIKADEKRWECGNYFQNKDIAQVYRDRMLNLLKENV